MSLHLWEAIHDADVRSRPIFDIEPDMVSSQPPRLQRVLLAAATLWCRHLVWPTVREIGSLAAVSPSTSMRAVGSSSGLRRVLVAAELSTLRNDTLVCLDGREFSDVIPIIIKRRMHRLASIEESLRRLPLLAGLSTRTPEIEALMAATLARSVATDRLPASAVA